MNKAQTILKSVFGYDSFRPLQKEIIENVLNKKDSLVVMPTGGGKSLCYQIPALIFDGLTLVISPLISLMKDQVEQLQQNGASAALLNSSLSPEEYQHNLESVIKGDAKLLYLAPESTAREDIVELFSKVRIDCITIDEAHCISEWGHDFRKDYRLLGKLRQKFPSAACIGLTATATPRVQDDIIKNLNMESPKRFVASFDRKSLFLQILPKQNSFQQTVGFLNEHKNQSGIIYCFSRRQVDDLSEDLSNLGFSTRPYHAGLSDQERNDNQDLFIKDKVDIIVATIAFGMGINKSNVRFVLHHDLPKNIESYYQEIGRAGRDGLRADCLLLFSYSDISKINYFIAQKEDEVERTSAIVHLDAMVKYAESELCRRIPLINYFGEKFHTDNCGMCDNCTTENEDKIDITIPAQKFLSTVKRTGEIFGANYIIDILLGSNSDRIFSNGHQNLSVYDVGKEFNKKQWQMLSRQLVSKELLFRDIEFGSLKLKPKAIDVLLHNTKVFGIVEEHKASTVKAKHQDLSYDHELFDILRAKRKEIADAKSIPAYIVFSDRTLTEMAAKYPTDKLSFLNISGVGHAKYQTYGEKFIDIIRKYCTTKSIHRISSNKGSTRKNDGTKRRYVIVSESFNNGNSITKLAEEYKVTKGTIIGHIARYANEGFSIRLDGLYENISLPKEQWDKVFKELDEEGTMKLSPIYEKLNQEVSYDDLHILRILYTHK